MRKLTAHAFATAFVLLLLSEQTLRAQPMKCSGEEKNCNTLCLKSGRAAPVNCREICHVARQICVRTGCWDDGTGNKYCGLTKQ
jgi:hypothetical protein